MESGHIKVDQMRKQYDFKIKGAKVFAACNEITRLSRPLQSRFRRLHLPRYSEEQFLEVSAKVLPKLKIAYVIGKVVWDQRETRSNSVLGFRSYDSIIPFVFTLIVNLYVLSNGIVYVPSTAIVSVPFTLTNLSISKACTGPCKLVTFAKT
jgi:hypothetical protein